jgi:hypothetical protein
MTSEVVILNRKGIVLAADSAVTTGVTNAKHPRYSKAANKIFDITPHGTVAATIFGNAHLDNVPWELALKLFRATLNAQAPLSSCRDYLTALIGYLTNSQPLFPANYLGGAFKINRFVEAARWVLEVAGEAAPAVLDTNAQAAARQQAWQQVLPNLQTRYAGMPVHPGLPAADYQTELANTAALVVELTAQLAAPAFAAVGIAPQDLAALSVEAIYKEPTQFLSSTGLVVGGYGADEIFPSYKCVDIYGHVGTALLVVDESDYAVTHDNGAWIQAFAKSSMIDMFTRGYDFTLWQIIGNHSEQKLNGLVDELRAAGVVVPPAVADPAVQKMKADFSQAWIGENLARNHAPLRRVLDGLGIGEMADLAETLLTLESLKERVTSPSESVGGPIDVAAITKGEGLVWIKRKHFFDPALNLRYVNRIHG